MAELAGLILNGLLISGGIGVTIYILLGAMSSEEDDTSC